MHNLKIYSWCNGPTLGDHQHDSTHHFPSCAVERWKNSYSRWNIHQQTELGREACDAHCSAVCHSVARHGEFPIQILQLYAECEYHWAGMSMFPCNILHAFFATNSHTHTHTITHTHTHAHIDIYVFNPFMLSAPKSNLTIVLKYFRQNHILESILKRNANQKDTNNTCIIKKSS